jgi:hypothetical protein
MRAIGPSDEAAPLSDDANSAPARRAVSLLVAQIKSLTAAASAAFLFGASTVPRYCPRFRMIDTRQVRSLAAAGFFLTLFIGIKERALDERAIIECLAACS